MSDTQDVNNEEFIDCVPEYCNVGEISKIDLYKVRKQYRAAECDLAKKFATKIENDPYSANDFKINTPQESYSQEMSISKMIEDFENDFYHMKRSFEQSEKLLNSMQENLNVMKSAFRAYEKARINEVHIKESVEEAMSC